MNIAITRKPCPRPTSTGRHPRWAYDIEFSDREGADGPVWIGLATSSDEAGVIGALAEYLADGSESGFARLLDWDLDERLEAK